MKLDNGTYIRPQRRYSWWLGSANYFQYMMRELSSLFIGAFSILLIWGVWQFSQGEVAYTQWLNNLWENLIWFSLICLVFATYHSLTWFWVTPKAMPMSFNNKPIKGSVIIAGHILAWMLVTVIVWLIVAGGI